MISGARGLPGGASVLGLSRFEYMRMKDFFMQELDDIFADLSLDTSHELSAGRLLLFYKQFLLMVLIQK